MRENILMMLNWAYVSMIKLSVAIITPWRAIYGVTFVNVCAKTDRVPTAPHWIVLNDFIYLPVCVRAYD